MDALAYSTLNYQTVTRQKNQQMNRHANNQTEKPADEHKCKQSDRQTNQQMNRHANNQTEKPTIEQTCKQLDRQTNR